MTAADPLEALRGRIDLRHVPFTDHLSRLLLREKDDGLMIALAAYERPAIDCMVLRGLRFTSNDVALHAESSARPDRIDVRTPAGAFGIVFADADTLVIARPTGNTGLAFDLATDHIEAGDGVAFARSGGASPCRLVWSGEWAVSRPHGPGEIRVHLRAPEGNTNPIVLQVISEPHELRQISEPQDAFVAAERGWRDWLARVPDVLPELRPMALYAWWVLRANQILPEFDPRRAGVAPSKIGYVGIWNWDSCFHALGLRHGDPEAAKDQLRIILAHQSPDGMLPDVVYDAGVLASTLDLPLSEQGYGLPPGWDPGVPMPLTKPPLMAWAARAIWEKDGDADFLEEVYEPVSLALGWWFRTADPDGNGLFGYDHPYSSGLDDSPLWDGGSPVEAPELNAYLVLQCDNMAAIAATIGRHQDVLRWRQRAAAITSQLVAHRWDDRAGLFVSSRHGEPIPVATPFGMMPLLTGRLGKRIVRRLVETMSDPGRFWPRHPVPTVALDDPTFEPGRMWRGPVWLNVNRLLVEGLARSGRPAEAAALRRHTLELAISQPDFREYYDPLTGASPQRAAPMFSWAAAAFLDLAVAETHASAG